MGIQDIRALMASGSLDPQKDLVWNEGMPDWIQPSQVPELMAVHDDTTNPQQPFAYQTTTGAIEEIPPGSEPIIPTACVKRAYHLLIKQIRPLLAISFLYYFITYGLTALSTYIGTRFDLLAPEPDEFTSFSEIFLTSFSTFEIFSFIFETIIGIWLTLGVLRIVLDVVDGKEVSVRQLFSSGHLLLKGFATYVLYGLGIILGSILLIFPGIYFALRYSQCLYGVVDRNLGIIESFKYSAQLTKGNLGNLFLIWLLIFAITLAGCLAFIIGLIFTYPLTLITTAVAYRWMQYGARAIADHPATGAPLLASRSDLPQSNPEN